MVWEYLPLGIRDRFLERTARALALSPTDQLASLEPLLIGAILRPENVDAIALLGVDRAVDVLEQLADHVTPETVLALTKGPKLPANCSRPARAPCGLSRSQGGREEASQTR